MLLLVACATTPDPAGSTLVSLDGIELATEPDQVVLLLNLQNRSDEILPVSALRYRVELDDTEFAWGTSQQSVEVPAQGEALFEIVVPGRLPAMQTGQTQLRYSLSGMIQLGGKRSPVTFTQDGRLNWRAANSP